LESGIRDKHPGSATLNRSTESHRRCYVSFFSLWQDYGEAIQHLEDANWVLVDAVNRALPGSAASGDDVTVQHPPIHVIDDDDEESNPRPAVSPPPSQFRPPLPFFMPGDSGGGGGGGGFAGGLSPASFFAAEAAGVAGSSGSGRGARSAAAGVSMAADFLPMGPSQRSRLLELHIEYRDRMIHLKVNLVCLFY
jgi:hypothetical protein